MSLESGVLRYKSGVSMKRNCSHFEGWLSCQRWWGLVFRRRNRRPLLQQSKYFPHNYLGKYFPQKVKPKPLYLRAIWSGLGAIDILGAINFARKRHRDPVQLLPPESTPSLSLSLSHTHTHTFSLALSLSLSLPPCLPLTLFLSLSLARAHAVSTLCCAYFLQKVKPNPQSLDPALPTRGCPAAWLVGFRV